MRVTFTVRGAGADIWGADDAFHFVYQPLNGDGQIVARVASVQNVYAWTKAGVMIRNTLDTNSANGFMLVSAANGEQYQYRTRPGLTTTGVKGATSAAPYWVKVTRSGSSVTGYQSADGVTWVKIAATTETLGTAIYVGLGVSSHNASTPATATFDHVTVTSTGGGGTLLPTPWVDDDVGGVGKPGNATFANGVFTVNGAGANIWSTADSFNYVDRNFNGDSSITARITSLGNTATHAKSGVMFRESLDAGSREVVLDYEPTGNIEFMHRAATNGKLRASPVARHLAAEHGIDIARIQGSGPQGRVIRADESNTD